MDVSNGSRGVLALAAQYGFDDAAGFVLDHIEALKATENLLANRCGHVLEATVGGFGVGQETALLLIGVGQALLGNPLTAGSAVAITTNPIAMTCAALGAVHYGWTALSERERDAFIKLVGSAFSVGAELIRSLAHFAADLIRQLLSKENMAELKRLVAAAAAQFGNGLSHVTRAVGDRAREVYESVAGSAYRLAGVARARLPEVRGRRSKSP